MLAFLKKMQWKSHVKLATQNALACRYLVNFEKSSTEAGLTAGSLSSSVFETDLETSTGYLADLRLGKPLRSMIAGDALKMNRDLRRVYDAVYKGRRAFASHFGQASERLLPFDPMFTPNEGWKIYLEHFRQADDSVQRNEDLALAWNASAFLPDETQRPTQNDPRGLLRSTNIVSDRDMGSTHPKDVTKATFCQDAANAGEEGVFPGAEEKELKIWEYLSLGTEELPPADLDDSVDCLVEQGRAAGMDADRLREAFESVTPEKLRELGVVGKALARLDAEQNLRVRLQQLQNSVSENKPVDAVRTDTKETESPVGTWTVQVDDHFHYMRLEERYVYGKYDSYEAAADVCRMIVDRSLAGEEAKSADELVMSYLSFGEDPWIEGPAPEPGQPRFSALDYAKQRSREIHPKE